MHLRLGRVLIGAFAVVRTFRVMTVVICNIVIVIIVIVAQVIRVLVAGIAEVARPGLRLLSLVVQRLLHLAIAVTLPLALTLTLVATTRSVNVMAMNESKFRRLSPEYQKIILDAGREQHEHLKGLITKEKEENLTFFKAKGLKILNPRDMAAWRAQVKDFPTRYGHLWGKPELFDQIQETKY